MTLVESQRHRGKITETNDSTVVNTQFEGIWKETVVLFLKVKFGHLPKEIEVIHEGSSVRVTPVLVNRRNARANKPQI